MLPAFQEQVISCDVIRILAGHLNLFINIQFNSQGIDYFSRNFILIGKHVIDDAGIALRLKVMAGSCIYQLGGYADFVTSLSHAAFQHITNSEFFGHLHYFYRFALVNKGRVACDDE